MNTINMVGARIEQSTTTNKQTNTQRGREREKKNIKGGSLVDVSLTMTLYNDKMHE